MPPFWKIKRELTRLKDQAIDIPRVIVEGKLRQRYDRTRWARICITGTTTVQSKKICVFLVFQPDAFAQSLQETFAFLTSKGYDIVVVANRGLKDATRAQISPKVWRILERPNFGYDFGGWRDAIHFLQREAVEIDQLLLMNDSIWFPMHSKSDVLERLESSEFDLTGLLYHVPARNEDLVPQTSDPGLTKRPEHIESYVTMVSAQILASDAFWQFWQNYAQTSSKLLTIKRGEAGFSNAMMQAGFSVGALSRRSLFIQMMNDSPDAFIEKALRNAAYSDASFQQEADDLLATTTDPNWRAAALAHITKVVQIRRFNASYPWATEVFFQTTFVKKNTDRLFQLGRIQFLRGVENGDIACDNEAALDEIKVLVAKDHVQISGGGY